MWNAPTWFLSALTFATVCLPFALPAIARWRKKGLKTAMLVLTAVSVIAKVAYSYDTNGWFFMEGKFFVILVQAMRLTSCFVYRMRTRKPGSRWAARSPRTACTTSAPNGT